MEIRIGRKGKILSLPSPTFEERQIDRSICGSKLTYSTQGGAAKALATLKKRKQDGTILDMCWASRAYFCTEHEGWHLTKTELRRPKLPSDVFI